MPSSYLAIVGATATGKSRLAIELAKWLEGEVIACDSTAVYRRFDIGTDKVPVEEQEDIPHHLVDLVEPTEAYSAAKYAHDAAAAIRAVAARGKVPVVAGGTGFYFRALTRGLFPGPARDAALRARLTRVAARRGVEALHRWLARVDEPSASRIQPRDGLRLVRALEVWLLTGKTLTAHFADTCRPLPEFTPVVLGLQIPSALTAERVARRVEQQFARGVVDEVRAILAEGIPESAHPFTGLVYKQILEYLHGVRGEAETRALIVRENRHYARRQLIWFRKEPNLHWLRGPGEERATLDEARRLLGAMGCFL